MGSSWRRPRVAGRCSGGEGRRGHRAVARIEKLVMARMVVERKIDQQIEQAVIRARTRGVPWPRIGRALGATPRWARRRYRPVTERIGRGR